MERLFSALDIVAWVVIGVCSLDLLRIAFTFWYYELSKSGELRKTLLRLERKVPNYNVINSGIPLAAAIIWLVTK